MGSNFSTQKLCVSDSQLNMEYLVVNMYLLKNHTEQFQNQIERGKIDTPNDRLIR